MELKIITSMLLSFLLTSQHSIAATNSFSDAYQNYQSAIQSRDWQLSLTASELALEEGLKIFDEKGENIANLRLNHAIELMQGKQFERAIDLLSASLDVKSNILGSESPDLIGVLLPLGKATAQTNLNEAKTYFARALLLAEGNEAIRAKLHLDAGLALFAAGDKKISEKYLSEAQRYYQQHFGKEDIRSGIASLNLGRIYYEARTYEQSLSALNNALEAFGSSDATSQKFNSATLEMLVLVDKVNRVNQGRIDMFSNIPQITSPEHSRGY